MTTTALRNEPLPDPDPATVPAGPPAWLTLARRLAVSRWLPRLVAMLAAVPAVTTLFEVLRAGRLQHIDYLFQLTRITNADGSLKPFDLQHYFSNEHLLGLPTLLYWINIELFAGDNRTLGVFVVAMAALTVAALGLALPRGLPPLVRAGLVVAASTLVFSLHGLWNFTRAMSGTAWLTANLIVVVALVLASRGRWWPAFALALLASLTYGTAFAVWPVLAGLAVLRREAWWKRLLPLVAGAAIVSVWLSYRPSPPLAGSPVSDPGSLLYYFLAIVGKLWTTDNGGLAAIAGALILGVYAVLATSRTAREPALWFWWALAGHAVLYCGMIAVARVDFGEEASLHTARYTSASVLISIPAVVMLAFVAHRRLDQRGHKITLAAVLAGLLGYALGAPYAVEERAADKLHRLEAVAIRGGFSDAYRTYPLASDLAPRLRALGHYPFTDDFTLGCDGPELGSTLALSEMTPLLPARGNKRPLRAAGAVDSVEPPDPAPTFDGRPVPIFHGWAYDRGDPVRCVVIVDGAGTVQGGGVTGVVHPDLARAYAGVAADSGFAVIGPVEDDSRIVVIQRSGSMRWLPARAPEVIVDRQAER
ncbi:hypothetical protein [Actinophytocola sediminis]